ncbi:hypothetical protein GCM10010275_18030 [Streptomyces litmocidini]|nr:hypothetical protein GCM10010275_18030 [Streptomyces litmocidini]
MKAGVRSGALVMPAGVYTLPSRIHRGAGSTRTSGWPFAGCGANGQWGVARRPSRRPAAASTAAPVRFLVHRGPTRLALALATFADGLPTASFLAALLVVMPLCYLALGAVRGELGDRRTLAVQAAGLVVFRAWAAVALLLDGRTALYAVAVGWFAHALWDLSHHRTGRGVPRAWSEGCGVVDASGVLAVVLLVRPRPHGTGTACGRPSAAGVTGWVRPTGSGRGGRPCGTTVPARAASITPRPGRRRAGRR